MGKDERPGGKTRKAAKAGQIAESRRLDLLSAEVDRELASLSARQANAVTRASIVLAASGVTTFASQTLSPGWSLVPALFSLIAAGLSLSAIRLWHSAAARLDRGSAAELLKHDGLSIQWRLLADKLAESKAATSDLDQKNEYLTASMRFLLLSWVLSFTVLLVISPIIEQAN